MRREWEEAHKVTEELVEGPPSRRANATFTASPDGVSALHPLDAAECLILGETAVRITYGQSGVNSSVTTERR